MASVLGMARRFQFDLRTIFILISSVAVAYVAGPWLWRRIWYSEMGHMTVIVVEDHGTHARYKEI
jgi:hypothetical protein